MSQEIGPKSVVLNVEPLELTFETPGLELRREVSVNDAPRARQVWRVSNAYFNFLGTTKEAATIIKTTQFQFGISMFIGGVQVAEQLFLESAPLSSHGESTAFPVVGSLEPIQTAAVYPGQDIRFLIRLFKSSAVNGFVKTPTGLIVVNYTLILPDSVRAKQ